MVWSNTGPRFSFGQLDAAQQSQFEDHPDLAFQKLMDWYGQGDPNFANTTLGRYIASQLKSRIDPQYDIAAGENQKALAGEKSAWDQQQQRDQWAFEDQQKNNEAAYNQELQHWNDEYQRGKLGLGGVPNQATMAIAMDNINRLNANPYQRTAWTPKTFTPQTKQLTLTGYLEDNPDAQGGLAHQFGLLTANQRGATPGAFQVRRNLW